MKIQLAFYKGKGDWMDKVIRWWTRSPYSHCEIVIDGIWYSSSPRTGKVRAATIYPKENHWDFIELLCTAEQKQIMVRALESQLGKPYDYLGIFLSQVIPLSIQDPTKWFCSEICSCALKKGKLLKTNRKSCWFSPARLYRALAQAI